MNPAACGMNRILFGGIVCGVKMGRMNPTATNFFFKVGFGTYATKVAKNHPSTRAEMNSAPTRDLGNRLGQGVRYQREKKRKSKLLHSEKPFPLTLILSPQGRGDR